MKNIYNITDSSDGDTLITIATNTQGTLRLSKIKKNTDKIWYAASTGESILSIAEENIADSTKNGDWNEIFEALLKADDIDYELVTITEI